MSSTPGAVATPTASATNLVAHLSIASAPAPHTGADVGQAGQLAQRGQRAVLAARAVHDREHHVAAAQHVHGAGQPDRAAAAVAPGPVGSIVSRTTS